MHISILQCFKALDAIAHPDVSLEPPSWTQVVRTCKCFVGSPRILESKQSGNQLASRESLYMICMYIYIYVLYIYIYIYIERERERQLYYSKCTLIYTNHIGVPATTVWCHTPYPLSRFHQAPSPLRCVCAVSAASRIKHHNDVIAWKHNLVTWS